MLARKFLYVVAGARRGHPCGGDRLEPVSRAHPALHLRAARGLRGRPAGAVDYTRRSSWVARPGLTDDPSRWHPPGFARDAPGPAAIFYVRRRPIWRATAGTRRSDDRAADARLRIFVASQAERVQRLGPVWAPRYRQATAGAFLTDKPEAARALAFAYADVERAFDAFLAATPPDRPIVLARTQPGLHST